MLPAVLAGWVVGLAGGQLLLGPDAAAWALPMAIVVCAAAMGLLAARPPGVPLAAAVVVAAAIVGVWRGSATVHVVGPGTLDYYTGRHATLYGTVARSSGSAGFEAFRLDNLTMSGRHLEGALHVTARTPVQLVPGSTARVTGFVERLPRRAPDGTTGFDQRMERAGVLATMAGAGVQPVDPAPPGSAAALAWRLRASMASAVRTAVPEPEATILLGELLGLRAKLPAPVEADLVGSGLVHLLAVSGLKVALVAGALAALLRQAGRRAAILAIAGVFAYAVVGGGSSAAMRAAVMGSMGLVAQALRRDVDPARALLLAGAVLLGLHPPLFGDLSFQYSFLGVAGIQFLARPLDGHLWWVPAPFREALSVSLAAQAATAPLTAAYFHLVSLSGPVANTLAVPLLPATMAVTAWTAVGLPDPGGLAAATGMGLARVLLGLAAGATRAPAGVVAVPWFGVNHVVGYFVAVLVAVVLSRVQAEWPLVVGGAAVAALAVMAWTARPDGLLHIDVLDTVGAGALVTAPDGAHLLVDTGSSPSALSASLDADLVPLGQPLDAVLLTDSSPIAAAGIGGLGPRVPRLILLPDAAVGDAARRAAEVFAAHGAAVQELRPGDRFTWHGVALAVDSCGAALSVTVRFGQAAAWLCTAATVADPGAPPPGHIDLVDTGDPAAVPEGGLSEAGWVVQHGAASRATAHAGSVWRPSKDGPLRLTCGPSGCTAS
ncbi:MAG: ComEC/Rec2 family competence protein [Candidatus Dormibacteria bacterium]